LTGDDNSTWGVHREVREVHRELTHPGGGQEVSSLLNLSRRVGRMERKSKDQSIDPK